MDLSAASWLSDLLMQETEDCNLFRQCHLNLLGDDEESLSHDIASALHGEDLQQPLSSASYSSQSETHSNKSTDETSLERPTKQLKTNTCGWNSSTTTKHFSPNLSPSSPTSQVVSFDSSPANTTQFYGLVSTLNPKQNKGVSVSPPQTRKGSSQNKNFETKNPKGKRTDKSSAHAQDHIMAERKRREKLSQSLIALAALIPGLKKMDKASILGDAIKYMKELQERLRLLEEQSKNSDVESVVMLNDHSPSRDDGDFDAGSGRETLPHVVARVLENEVLLRIHCQKQKGLLLKILVEIQNLHLFVVNSSVLPFGDATLDITIVAQMGTGYNSTINDLVKNLRATTLKSMT